MYEACSVGNQFKFYSSGRWYKLDSRNNYEGLAEDLISSFEDCIQDFLFVRYKSIKTDWNGVSLRGCYSQDMFTRSDLAFISLRQLLRQARIPYNILIKCQSTKDNISNVINCCRDLTGLDLLSYFSRLLFLDSIILNEDRHPGNMGILYTGGRFYEAPCFDNGFSLFCTNWTYRVRKTMEQNYQAAKSVARPFSKFFDKQVDAVRGLGAEPLRISRAGVSQLMGYTNPLYPSDVVERSKEVLFHQLQVYEGRSFVYV